MRLQLLISYHHTYLWAMVQRSTRPSTCKAALPPPYLIVDAGASTVYATVHTRRPYAYDASNSSKSQRATARQDLIACLPGPWHYCVTRGPVNEPRHKCEGSPNPTLCLAHRYPLRRRPNLDIVGADRPLLGPANMRRRTLR